MVDLGKARTESGYLYVDYTVFAGYGIPYDTASTYMRQLIKEGIYRKVPSKNGRARFVLSENYEPYLQQMYTTQIDANRRREIEKIIFNQKGWKQPAFHDLHVLIPADNNELHKQFSVENFDFWELAQEFQSQFKIPCDVYKPKDSNNDIVVGKIANKYNFNIFKNVISASIKLTNNPKPAFDLKEYEKIFNCVRNDILTNLEYKNMKTESKHISLPSVKSWQVTNIHLNRDSLDRSNYNGKQLIGNLYPHVAYRIYTHDFIDNVEPCRIELMMSPDQTVTLDNIISYVMNFDPLHM